MGGGRQLSLLLSFALLAVVSCQEGQANPYLAPFGLGLTFPRPLSLTGCNAPTYLAVGNSGSEAAENVDVTLSTAEWGISFGEWSEVGKATVSVGPESTETVEFRPTLQTAALQCLQASIVGSDGGNTNEKDDTTQSNQEFLYSMDEDSYLVPVRTGLDGDSITIHGVSFGCVMDDGSTETTTVDGPGSFSMYCGDNEIKFEMPELGENGTVVLPPGSEIFGRISVNFGALVLAEKGANNGEGWQFSDRLGTMAASGVADVVVLAQTSTGEESNAVVRFAKTTVEALLNTPRLCDIKSIKTRVLLETALAAALTAYEEENIPRALAHLVNFMDKAENSKCDLDCEETPALESAMLAAGDAARMMSTKDFLGPEIINEQTKHAADNHRRDRDHRATARYHMRKSRRL